METKKHGKLTLALAMIGGLAALSIAYAAISTQLNIQTGDTSEQVVASADVRFTEAVPYGVSKVTDGVTSATAYEGTAGTTFTSDAATCAGATIEGVDNGSIEISAAKKEDDTVTINGTILRDYDAFAVYKVKIHNDGKSAVKLTNDPNTKAVTDFTADSTNGTLKNNIRIDVYTDATCTEEVKPYSAGATDTNYIAGESDIYWYVKVSHRTHGSGDDYSGTDPTNNDGITNDITDGTFGFKITPTWENA